MTQRITFAAAGIAALLAGCETAPGVANNVDAAGLPEDLGAVSPSSTCRTLGDGGTLRSQATWRVVAYEAEDPIARGDAGLDLDAARPELDGGATAITRYTADGERVVDPATGNASVLRVNGAMRVTTTALQLALGLLRDDVFVGGAPSELAVSAYDGSGVLTAEERRFVAPTGMVGFELCAGDADQLVVRTLGGASRRIFLAPDPTPALETRAVTLRVRALDGVGAMPLMAPRTAILWDLPGGATLVETLGASATLTGARVERRVDLQVPRGDGAPPRFALGHPVLYDDLDQDGRFDPARDAVRSLGTLVAAWRDPAASLDDDAIASRLRPGWQLAVLHANPEGATVALPLDRATEVPLTAFATGAPAAPPRDLIP